jgi:hypothetical protein
MAAYDAYLTGKLEDFSYPAEKVAAAMEKVPVVA